MDKEENSILYITGGGGLASNCINITTIASIVAASFGIKVIKHVSYDSNKRCPSAVFLEGLDIDVSTSFQDIEENFENHGIVFIEAMPELVLDNMCPLISKIEKTCRLVGINNADNAMRYLFELKSKNYKRVMIISPSNSKYDEFSVSSTTQIFELKDDKIYSSIVSPRDYLINQADDIEMTGATPLYNVNLAVDILSNKIKGAKLDVIAINSAIMLYISGYTNDIKSGIIASYLAVENGQALEKLETLRKK